MAEERDTGDRGVKIFEETPRISKRRIEKKSGKVDRLARAIYPHLSSPPSFHFGSRRDNRATVARRDSGGLILDRFRSYSIVLVLSTIDPESRQLYVVVYMSYEFIKCVCAYIDMHAYACVRRSRDTRDRGSNYYYYHNHLRGRKLKSWFVCQIKGANVAFSLENRKSVSNVPGE